LLLQHFTDTDVAWWDALPTALSLVGQALLGRKYIENWLVWLVVNAVSVALFVHKELWLTALLYALFTAMSVWGWRAWQRKLQLQTS
jgi:nicotinamide mononucleotide transporter